MEMKKRTYNFLKINPIAASIILSLPLAAHADIVMKNGASVMANGVPVVNINGANANGISHNVYDKLNVGKEGLVFNNSKESVNSQLAGQIAGNGNLSAGTAKVILNEVTSNNRSNLNGMLEVAGDKAHLIIANPSGITCDTCGFINTNKVTLTTGTPDMSNGELKGYTVSGGDIKVNNKLTNDSPTAILARSVAVTGEIRTPSDLTIITGTNKVDTQDNVTAPVNVSWWDSLWKEQYGVDVSKLGGMYAGKIKLVSTEKGVGVRNQGVISANSELQINANGQLINSNASLQSSGNLDMQLAGSLDNVTGKISSGKAINIDTNKNTINNSRSGNILSSGDINIGSGYLDNTNGKIAGAGTVAINTNKERLRNYGKGSKVGISANVVLLDTGHLENSNGQIQGNYVATQSSYVNNNNGMIDSYTDVVMLSEGNTDNTSGLIRAGEGKVQIDSSRGTLWNNKTRTPAVDTSDSKGIIAGDGGIEIKSNKLDSNGQIVSSGNISIQNYDHVSNRGGQINSSNAISISSKSLDTGTGAITAMNGDVKILALNGAVENSIGWISSNDGSVNITAQRVNNQGGLIAGGLDVNISSGSEVNNSYALISAKRDVTINARTDVKNDHGLQFGAEYGRYLGMSGQVGGIIGQNAVTITGERIHADQSRIIANNGVLSMNAIDRINNTDGQLVGRGGVVIDGGWLQNNYGTIYSAKDTDIKVKWLDMASSGEIIDNNAKGIISSDNNLKLNVSDNFTNYGWITAGNDLTLTSNRTINNHNTISAGNTVNINANYVNNFKDIVADKALNATVADKIYNTGNLFTKGTANVQARHIENRPSGLIGGREGTTLTTSKLDNRGSIVGL
jgi:filamentous hemagglutinin family protein